MTFEIVNGSLRKMEALKFHGNIILLLKCLVSSIGRIY